MSISFESAVATLKSMFPEWDEETLSTILMSNNYHVEQTIETVLSMGDTTGADAPSRGSTSSPQTAPYAAPAPAPTSRHQSPPAQRAPSSSSSGNPRNRGLKCDLPDDFLRPPNWQNKHTILADEELALMLQNEMFQAEARRVLGEDFMREAYGEDYAVGGSRPAAPRRGPSGRVQPASSAQQDGDLGIVKALGSMGAAAKRSLTQLAQRFNSNDSGTATHYPTGNQPQGSSTQYVSRGGMGGGSTPGQTVRRRRGSGSGRRKGQFNDLDDDDEEGTEIITFSSNARSEHMLQGGGSSSGAPPAYADGEEDEEDSANPLLARQTTNQVI